MNDRLPQLGAPEPEQETSPIVDEAAFDETAAAPPPESGGPVCLFNGEPFAPGSFVLSGNELLKCERGVWVRQGAEPAAPS